MTAEQAISWLTLKPKNLPVFVLVATDPLAPDTIEEWRFLASRAGVNAQKVESAREVIFQCLRWPEKNIPG